MAARSLALIGICGCSCTSSRFRRAPAPPPRACPRIPSEVVKQRAAQLREKGEQALRRHLQTQVGRRLRVLTERGGIGRADDFTPVKTPGLPPGMLVWGEATAFDLGSLDLTFD